MLNLGEPGDWSVKWNKKKKIKKKKIRDTAVISNQRKPWLRPEHTQKQKVPQHHVKIVQSCSKHHICEAEYSHANKAHAESCFTRLSRVRSTPL